MGVKDQKKLQKQKKREKKIKDKNIGKSVGPSKEDKLFGTMYLALIGIMVLLFSVFVFYNMYR